MKRSTAKHFGKRNLCGQMRRKSVNRIIKRALSILTCGCMLVLASGCGSVNDEKQVDQQNNTEAEHEFSMQNDDKKIYKQIWKV